MRLADLVQELPEGAPHVAGGDGGQNDAPARAAVDTIPARHLEVGHVGARQLALHVG